MAKEKSKVLYDSSGRPYKKASHYVKWMIIGIILMGVMQLLWLSGVATALMGTSFVGGILNFLFIAVTFVGAIMFILNLGSLIRGKREESDDWSK